MTRQRSGGLAQKPGGTGCALAELSEVQPVQGCREHSGSRHRRDCLSHRSSPAATWLLNHISSLAHLACVAFGIALFCAPIATQPTAGPPRQTTAQRNDALAAETEQAMLEAVQKGEAQRAFAIVEGARSKGLPLGVYHLLKAKVYATQRNTTEEERQLRGAVQRDPSLSEAYLRLGAIMESRGLWLDAADIYRASIEANPAATQPYLELSRVLIRHARNKSGIAVLEDAKQVAPDNALVLATLAAAYEHVGEVKRAREQYRLAARMGEGQVRRRSLVKVGDLSLADAEFANAFAYYRAALADGVAVNAQLYNRVAHAADETAWQVLEAPWTAFEDYMAGKLDAPEREDVYETLSAALKEERELTAVIDDIAPPQGLAAEHAQRRLQNGLLCEALTNAVSHLDTGDETLLAESRNRRADALAAKRALSEMRRKQP